MPSSCALLYPLPLAFRRSSVGLLTMFKPIWLSKPSLNPKPFFHSNRTHFSFFRLELVVPIPSRFRLVQHAHASSSGRTVWDEAADSYFGGQNIDSAPSRGPDVPPSLRGARVNIRAIGSRGDRDAGEGRQHRERERDNGVSQAGREGYSGGRSARRECDALDSSLRKNAYERNHGGSAALRGPRTGEQYSRNVDFAGREWGSAKDNERQVGSRETSTWSKSAPEKRSSKPWSNGAGRGGSNAYRNDRRGGYAVGRRGGKMESGEADEFGGEEEGMDVEDWPKRETVNWRLEGEPLYGVAPIRAAFLAGRRQFYTLYVQENLVENVTSGKRKDKQSVNWLLSRAHNLELKLKTVSKHDLNLLVDNRPHQGLVLDAAPLELVPREYLDNPVNFEGKAPVWVALDEVIDPQNFGAILRSCHYLGATGVVVCAKNSAPLSGVVSKASAGALEVMEIQSCRNMMKFLDSSVQNGWRAVGASSESRALPIQELLPGLPTILVLGNEGRGLRTNVKRSCTELVSIGGFNPKPGVQSSVQVEDNNKGSGVGIETDDIVHDTDSPPTFGAVDSLNVSVAAGILLHELLSRTVQPSIRAL